MYMLYGGIGLALLLGLASGIFLSRFLFRNRNGATEHEEAFQLSPIEDKEEHRVPSFSLLINQLLGILRQSLNSEGIVYLRREESGFRAAGASPGTDFRESLIPLNEGLFGLAVGEEKEIKAEVVQPQALPYLKDVKDAVSVLLYPVMRRGECAGILAAHKQIPAPFTDAEVLTAKRAARFLDEFEIFSSRSRKLEYLRVRSEKSAIGITNMLRQTDPGDMAEVAVKTLADILHCRHGFILLQSSQHNYASLFTHGFPPPPDDFTALERETWAYWVLAHDEEFVYLQGTVGKETAMPVLFKNEKLPSDRIALVQTLKSGDDPPLGVAGAIGTESEPFSEEDRASAQLFLKEASALITLAMINIKLGDLAIRDGLTGLFNRRYFNERFHHEFKRAERATEPLSFLMIDIDHFKKINDSYGHLFGDIVLKEITQRLSEHLRETDILCRYGGEEFAAILPACKIQEALEVAERVRSSVQSKVIQIAQGNEVTATISIGIASFPETCQSEKQLLTLTDGALYEAKKSGRNKVVLAKRK
jgi:diguanylate cyclase (GGDEF)-like protein